MTKVSTSLIFITGLLIGTILVPKIIPQVMFQPFSKEKTNYLGEAVSKEGFKFFNGKGLRSFHSRYSNVKCALIGGSTFYSSAIEQEYSFHQQLEMRTPKLSIENFTKNALSYQAGATVLKQMIRRGEKYKCLLLGLHFSDVKRFAERDVFPFEPMARTE